MSERSVKPLIQLIELLQPMEDDERLRTVRAALTYLGSSAAGVTTPDPAVLDALDRRDESGLPAGLPKPAEVWVKQNHLTAEVLEKVFHLADGDCQIITTVPGGGDKDRTRACYLLVGVRRLLNSGEPQVDDAAARDLCRNAGCYDSTNYNKYVKSLGNLVVAKNGADRLTQFGLKAAADLVKQLASRDG